MFSLVSGLYDSYLAPVQVNVLVVGAPGSGKTALLERIKVTEVPKRPPPLTPAQLATNALPPSLEQQLELGGIPEMSEMEQAAFKVKSIAKTSGNAAGEEAPHATSRSQALAADAAQPLKSPPAPSFTPTKPKRRFPLLFCPAPEKYRNNDADQDEDIIMDDDGDDDDDDGIVEKGINAQLQRNLESDETSPLKDAPNGGTARPSAANGDATAGMEPPMPPARARLHSHEISMDSIDLKDDDNDDNDSLAEVVSMLSGTPTPQPQNDAPTSLPASLYQDSDQQHHLSSKKKMFPLSKIRPTIGTNLAKLDVCGAKCHFFDVGGKLQNLWERYYDDCDAVIFVWKIGEEPKLGKKEGDADDDGSDDEEEEQYDYAQQYSLLQQVRENIGDDIPVLVLGQVFGGNLAEPYSQHFFSTDRLMPHYHNPIMRFRCASASTGVGVQEAMTWLIPLTKRQLKERQQRDAKTATMDGKLSN